MVAMPAWADSSFDPTDPGIAKRWTFSAAGFFVRFDTAASYDVDGAPFSAAVDLEDALGLESDVSEFRLEGAYRFNHRHRFDFGYVFLGRESKVVLLDQQIEWGGETIEFGAVVQSNFDTGIYQMAYHYTPFQWKRVKAGFSFGISAFDLDLGIAAAVDGTGPPNGEFEFEDAVGEKLLAPVPVLGTHLVYSPADRVFLRFNLKWFDLDLDDWEGSLFDGYVSADYFPWKNVGFGVAYDVFRIRYTKFGSERVTVNYDIKGIALYIRLAL